jgi:hypothetical protein
MFSEANSSRDLRQRISGTMPDRRSGGQTAAARPVTVRCLPRKRKGGRIYNFPIHRDPEGK